ncbi:major intrinsic protein [Aliidongia dinghuensis]|uniref:Major intrinsic protein n=1 Tax=Aliidongia dinghuensis TaxID=1867774 RepID=A0A8J3E3W8_9PROT|nr:MIP/aquaporin family protein [Aliidongia dinghuensis]GGF33992.1 major intrinsic protein [Aliidongia dinghuensis]
MHSAFMGEMFGTMILILLGNGVVACVLLQDSKGQNSGWIVITAGWAFAVLAGVFTALALGSDGHLNPAVTIGVAVSTGDWSKCATYIPAQFLGAFLGATLVWLQYLPHWSRTKDEGLKLACFCTAPAIRNLPSNAVSEIIGTFVLVFVAAAIFSKHIAAGGLPPGVGPYLVGVLVWGIGLSLGGTTGYAINPARDLGPRLAHALLPIAGKGRSDWGYALLPVIAPVIGAGAAGVLVKSFGL